MWDFFLVTILKEGTNMERKAASYFPADFTGIGNNRLGPICFHKWAESWPVC